MDKSQFPSPRRSRSEAYKTRSPAMAGRLAVRAGLNPVNHKLIAEALSAQKASPDTAQIPVIVVSADAPESQRASLLASGAAEYLPKPLDLHRPMAVSAEVIAAAHPACGGGT